MHVLSPQLGLSPEATLGGEVYDREILTRLARLGVEVDVLLPKGRPYAPTPNMVVQPVPLARGLRWPVSNAQFLPFIGRQQRRQPADILRVHSLRFTGPAVLAARRLYGLHAPIVAHYHHLDRDRWTDQIERRVAQRCDLVITGSEFSRQQMACELEVRRERISVVYYGVDDKYSPRARNTALARSESLEGHPILLYLGSLKERKNLAVLMQALHLALQSREDVRLAIVGLGESQAALQQQAKSLGVDHAVRFVGFVPEREKLDWLNLADLFVHPSRMEGFGFVAAEAMACGKPVVASRAGSLPEVVADGETGLLCNPDEPAEFAQAILRLLADRPMADAMGQAGIERVQRLFRWASSTSRTLALYEDMVHQWHPRR